MEERKFVRISLLIPSILVLYFVYRIFQPFIMPFILAVVLASLFYPAFSWLSSHIGERPNWAAFVACLAITAIIIVPVVTLIVMITKQAGQVYQSFEQAIQDPQSDWKTFLDPETLKSQPLIGDVIDFVDDYVDLDHLDLNLVDGLAQTASATSEFLFNLGRRFLSGVANLLTNFFIMLVTLFFLFRDGPALVQQMKSWTPLSEDYEQLIMDKFQEVAGATVLGSFVTALAQGAAGALVFWIAGIPNVVLWGALMALFSLVPLVGTAVVWVPWAIYLIYSGSLGWAVFLVAASVLFVGSIDNVLRPLLIEGKAKLHTLLVFFSIVGGIRYFGIEGMILGPILVALGLTFIELYKIEYRQELLKSGQLVAEEEENSEA